MGVFGLRKRTFIKNAFFLTATSLILRFVGVFFRVWLSGKIGAEGMGLYQMIFSVYVFASAFAASGLMTAVTRQVADRLSLGDKKGAVRSLRVSVMLTLFVAIVSMLAIFIFAEQIAVSFIKDVRSVPALKVLCFSLPCMGISSCFKGYFLARRRAGTQSVAMLLEQFVRIMLVFWLVGMTAHLGIGAAAAAVLAADVASEAVSMLFLLIGYLVDKRKVKGEGQKLSYIKILKQNLHISVPITAGKYLGTFLRTVENLLVPQSLSKYTTSYKHSLEQFGMIKGMALPILFFPASLLNSMTTLLIPEMSEAQAKNDRRTITVAVQKSFQITLVAAFIIGGVFFFMAERLGVLIYGSREVGFLIKALAPLVPVMYVDSMSDGILKGLDKQNATLLHSVLDSVLRIGFIYFFVPKKGMTAFLIIMFFSNILTCSLNAGRLLKTTGVKFNINNWFLKPFLCMLFSSAVSMLVTGFLKQFGNIMYVGSYCAVAIVLYIVAVIVTGAMSKNDIKSLYR